MPRSKRPETITLPLQVRYQCPECDAILDDGERRCSDCYKFGSRIEGIECPGCSEFIKAEDFPT